MITPQQELQRQYARIYSARTRARRKEPKPDKPNLKVRTISNTVCDHFGIHHDLIKLHDRRTEVVKPRHIAIILMRRYSDATFVKIAMFFGYSDHTTCLHAVRLAHLYAAEIEVIEQRLKALL